MLNYILIIYELYRSLAKDHRHRTDALKDELNFCRTLLVLAVVVILAAEVSINLSPR